FSTTEAPQGMTFRKVQTGSQLTAPLSGTITSPFGYREHPITGEADFHTGIDIAAGEGTAIHCAADGLVTEAGWSDIYGNYLVVQHSDNFSTKYAHCSRLIAQQGDVLRRGERIALVGSTGVSTGPHLHFETIVEELRCDPLWLLPL
ncbi:MAG: M23 family metallopeptidase, partial [Oscillospiraceae bacterium]|nr:M23 family metallopeptidase [Oscillospiraceae bacterium]